MSSTSTTQFYELTQYIGTDKPDFADNNEPFRKIDADLHQVVQDSQGFSSDIAGLTETVGGLSEDLTSLSGDLDGEKAKITALQNKELSQDAEIERVERNAQDMIVAYNEASATSTHAYAVGDYFIYNNVLYKATAAIAVGATIVPDTNCETTNVSTEIIKILSNLETKVSYTSVSGDTYASVLTKLDNLVNRSKLTEKSSLRASNNAAHCAEVSLGQFINTQVSGSAYNIIRYDLTNHDLRVWTTSTTGSSMTDASSDTVNAGTVFEIWY